MLSAEPRGSMTLDAAVCKLVRSGTDSDGQAKKDHVSTLFPVVCNHWNPHRLSHGDLQPNVDAVEVLNEVGHQGV